MTNVSPIKDSFYFIFFIMPPKAVLEHTISSVSWTERDWKKLKVTQISGRGNDSLSLDEELISRPAPVARKMTSEKERTSPIQTICLCGRWRGRREPWEVWGKGSSEEMGCWADKSIWMPTSGVMLNNSPIAQDTQIVMFLFFYYLYGFIFYIKIFNPSGIYFDVSIKYTCNVLCLPNWYINAPMYNHAITYRIKTCGNYTYFLPYLYFILYLYMYVYISIYPLILFSSVSLFFFSN